MTPAPSTPAPGVAIVGCGLIGQKRAKALGPARLMVCADLDLARAQALARPVSGAAATMDWAAAVARPDVQIVIVSVTNHALAPVTLAPEMATLSMGSVNFGGDVFMNHPADMEVFALAMREHGVKPELEIFDSGMLSTANRWLTKGLLEGPAHFDLVLGIPGGMAATAEALMYLRAQLPSGSSWTAAGIGAAQLPMGALAIVLGGHVRVGFEDNLYYRKGELASSNAQLVARMARLSRELDRAVATPDEARALLGIQARR